MEKLLTLKDISTKFIETLVKNFNVDLGDINDYDPKDDSPWDYYRCIYGHTDNGYFDVYFMSTEGEDEIEIAHTTDNPSEIESIIKNIEPKANII